VGDKRWKGFQLLPAGQGAVRHRLPADHPQKWLGAFAELRLKDEVRPKILKDTAAKLLGLQAVGRQED
jgi:hypothetical protein